MSRKHEKTVRMMTGPRSSNKLKPMKMAIAAERKSRSEDDVPRPRVGAVLVKDGKIEVSSRGEIDEGEHAEYTLMERKLIHRSIRGSTLYTTLEPCSSRNHPKSPCAERIVTRGIAKVFIGMLDPNPDVYGKGFLRMQKSGIKVEMFPLSLQRVIEKDNEQYIAYQESPSDQELSLRRLDDWYYAINSIYFDRNYYRDVGSIFAHLVEIVGGLTVLVTGKSKQGIEVWSHISKAIGWWFALCGKLNVGSVENLLWSKFPYVCPYCRKCPHDESDCAELKKRSGSPDWGKLSELGIQNAIQQPASLKRWQHMFLEIYPISQTENADVVFGRFTEELGELSEAMRVFQSVPTYFLSEAADVFAWLMHLANFIEARDRTPKKDRGRRLEKSLFDQYPDKCKDCHNAVCSCPAVLPSTLGRIAHEGPPVMTAEHGLTNILVSPAEMSSRFDIGTNFVIVGSTRLQVNRQLIREIRDTSSIVIEKIRNARKLQESTKNGLIARFERLVRLTRAHRLTNAYVDNALRFIIFMQPVEKKELLAILGKLEQGPWISAISRFTSSHMA